MSRLRVVVDVVLALEALVELHLPANGEGTGVFPLSGFSVVVDEVETAGAVLTSLEAGREGGRGGGGGGRGGRGIGGRGRGVGGGGRGV